MEKSIKKYYYTDYGKDDAYLFNKGLNDRSYNFFGSHRFIEDEKDSIRFTVWAPNAKILQHSSGALIAAYGYREKPYGNRVMISWDEGETWEKDYILSDDGQNGDLGYPASVELEDGRILTVYYQQVDEAAVIFQDIWSLPKKNA